jgi:hypothetical protein
MMFPIGRIRVCRVFLSSVLYLLVFLFLVGSAYSAQVTLAWDPNTNPNIAGYRIYYGSASGKYSNSVDVGNKTSYTLSNLSDKKTYYIAVTAYDRSGKESGLSNEVVFDASPPCDYSVSPTTQSFAAGGGGGTIDVTTGAKCSWTAVSNGSWLVVASKGSISGKDKVNFSALPNPSGSARTATLTVAGQSVTVTQSGMSYAITASPGSNGAISPNGSVTVSAGSSQAFTITPNAYYRVADVKVDGVSKGPITSYTFSNITSNHSISASFVMISYVITASAGSNGAISPNGSVTVSAGGSWNFTIKPNQNYKVADVKVDGASKGSITAYTFNNITSNHSISASFVMISYAITASAGSNGAISPNGSVTVSTGGIQTFAITPNQYYQVADVKVDGASVGKLRSYTFSNVTGNHTINASFSAITSNILVIEAENASIKTAGGTINKGWELWSNGTVGENVRIPAAGTYEVVVRAFGSRLGGVWPLMALSVDDLVGQPVTVDSAKFADYSFQVELTPGVHSIGVDFLNDAYNPGVEDRNLYLDKFAICSPPGIEKSEPASLLVVIEAENASIHTTGGTFYHGWNLWSNGIVGENVRIQAAGTYEVVVRAYGSPLGGVWPLMALSVDGYVGLPVIVGSADFAYYSFQVNLAPGIHSIGVDFLNDAYNPGVEDRNLYLDKFTIYSPSGM